MNTADKVLKIAAEEVGYLEKSKAAYKADPDVLYDKIKGAGSDNYTKYGKEMHDIYPAVMDFPAAWCDAFVDWCFYKAYGVTTAKSMIGGNFDDYTVNSANLYKKMNAWYTSPEVGDQIFFKNDTRICHTGLVEKVADGKIYTIEGNTSDKNVLEPNGGCVAKKSYSLNYSRIAGYGRPKYDKQEIILPDDDYIQGIDVSEYQGKIDWKQVKDAGIKFAILRSVTENLQVDPTFEKNLEGCIKYHIDYSCYKFCYARTHDEARQEADLVINLLGGRKMPIWYDMEKKEIAALGKDTIEGIILSFIGECKDAGYNDVGIYCNKTWYENYISQYLKDKYNFWIARYKKNDDGQIHEDIRPDWKHVICWQYTSKGRVPGINGNVDRDILF